MNNKEVMSRLQSVFDRIFLEKVEISAELSAADVEEWDSLTHITLLVAIEKAFSIRFRVGEVETAKNIGQFVSLIQSRLVEKAA